MKSATHSRKARAIRAVRSVFPDAMLLIDYPGAVITMGPTEPHVLWWHDAESSGPPHRAWMDMERDMRRHGLLD